MVMLVKLKMSRMEEALIKHDCMCATEEACLAGLVVEAKLHLLPN